MAGLDFFAVRIGVDKLLRGEMTVAEQEAFEADLPVAVLIDLEGEANYRRACWPSHAKNSPRVVLPLAPSGCSFVAERVAAIWSALKYEEQYRGRNGGRVS